MISVGNITSILVIYSIITFLTSSCLEPFPAITNSRKTILGSLGPTIHSTVSVFRAGGVDTQPSFYALYFPNLIIGGVFFVIACADFMTT